MRGFGFTRTGHVAQPGSHVGDARAVGGSAQMRAVKKERKCGVSK